MNTVSRIFFANPGGLHTLSSRVYSQIQLYRKEVARILHSQNHNIVFTRGGTESVNIAIHGVIENWLNKYPGQICHVITSSIEHSAVRNTLQHFVDAGLCELSELACQPNGVISINALSQMMKTNTALVTVQLVNNETGSLQPVREIARIVRESKAKHNGNGPVVYCDAIQAGPYVPIHLQSLNIDILSLSGSKIYGPKSSGVLCVRRGLELAKTFFGGDQELGMRAGTEDIVQIAGFSSALSIIYANMDTERTRIQALQHSLMSQIRSRFPQILINTDWEHSSPHIIHISIPGYDSEYAVLFFDAQGIAVASGSACSARSGNLSHVVAHLWRNLAENPNDYAHLRFSFGRDSQITDIDKIIYTLQLLLQSQYSRISS